MPSRISSRPRRFRVAAVARLSPVAARRRPPPRTLRADRGDLAAAGLHRARARAAAAEGPGGVDVVDGSSVVRLLDNLETAGLIRRKEGETDRRAKTIVLTARGNAIADKVETVARRIRGDALTGLSEKDIETAIRVSTMSAACSTPRGSRAVSAPLWLLTLITFSGTLAMHIFVPALPEAARDLGASVGECS